MTLLASIPVTRFKHTDAALPLCGTASTFFPLASKFRSIRRSRLIKIRGNFHRNWSLVNWHCNLSSVGICLDTFKDGDELRPLPCSHCFHRACVDEWLLGFKSDERTFTNNCPCCRQDISPGCSTHLNMFPTSCTIPLIDEVRLGTMKMSYKFELDLFKA